MKHYSIIIVSVVILMVTMSCSKDDNNNSSPTGIDFTTPEFMSDLDYYIVFDAESEYPDDNVIELLSKDDIVNCEFKINDILINTVWVEEDEFDEYFEWQCDIYLDELPDGIDLTQGSQLQISLLINGQNYSGNLTIPFKPIVDYPEFNLEEDYTFSWELSENANTQLVWFGCGNEQNDVFKNFQLNGSVRSYTINKDNYSAFSETGVNWLDLGIDTANYKDFGECLFLSYYSGNDFEIDGREKHISKKEKYLQFLKQIRQD